MKTSNETKDTGRFGSKWPATPVRNKTQLMTNFPASNHYIFFSQAYECYVNTHLSAWGTKSEVGFVVSLTHSFKRDELLTLTTNVLPNTMQSDNLPRPSCFCSVYYITNCREFCSWIQTNIPVNSFLIMDNTLMNKYRDYENFSMSTHYKYISSSRKINLSHFLSAE